MPEFQEPIAIEGFIPQHVLNCDMTGLTGPTSRQSLPQANDGQAKPLALHQCKWRLQHQAVARLPLRESRSFQEV